MQKHLETLFHCSTTGARVVKSEAGDYIIYDSPIYNYKLAQILHKAYPSMQISVNANPSSLSGFDVRLRLSSTFNEVVWPTVFGALFILLAFLLGDTWYPWCSSYFRAT